MDESLKTRVSWTLHFKIRNKITGRLEEFVDVIPDNLVVNEGLNKLLDIMFHGDSQVDPWFIGLKNDGSVVAGDTYASHGGWTEFKEYADDRKEFVEGAAASQAISNTGSIGQFDITSAGQVYGAMLCSIASKDSATGTLFSAGDISSHRTVDSGDQVNITLTIATSGT